MMHANRNEDVNRHGAEIYLDLENEASKRLADVLSESFTGAGSDVVVEGNRGRSLINDRTHCDG